MFGSFAGIPVIIFAVVSWTVVTLDGVGRVLPLLAPRGGAWWWWYVGVCALLFVNVNFNYLAWCAQYDISIGFSSVRCLCVQNASTDEPQLHGGPWRADHAPASAPASALTEPGGHESRLYARLLAEAEVRTTPPPVRSYGFLL
eukprot:SAG11_NODE_8356_length_1025_cov_1.236501_1_plen_144_part_00